MLKSVVFLGAGNVATCMGKAMFRHGMTIDAVYSRHIGHAKELAEQIGAKPVTDPGAVPADAALYVIAVPDRAIGDVSARLPEVNGLVVHTSGITSMDVLYRHKRKGVLYPLQTFTKSSGPDFNGMPMLTESSNHDDLEMLKNTVQQLGGVFYGIGSGQRQSIHLAAVFANNFTNHLYHIAQTILAENQLPFELLKPLITETAGKIRRMSPEEAQTGPAKRQDLQTIKLHLNLLREQPAYRSLYELLSASIADLNKQKY